MTRRMSLELLPMSVGPAPVLRAPPKWPRSEPPTPIPPTQALESKEVKTPHTPKIKSQLDDSNFDEYEDEGIQNYPDSNFPKEMFLEFAEAWVGK